MASAASASTLWSEASANASRRRITSSVTSRVNCGILFAAELVADAGGDAVGEALDALGVRAFHHHAGQGFGAGEADQDAAGIAEGGFGFADLVAHGGEIRKAEASFGDSGRIL